MIDRDIHLARALLVESNTLLRSIGTAQLKDLGIGHVSQTGRVQDARLLLEREHFDIVVCNREFDDGQMSGQDLLDELRRENLLPYSTVFLMVSNGASYHEVVEAAESSLDGLLLRPYSATALGERLSEARSRKRALSDIFKLIDAGDLEPAFARALKRFCDQQPYAAYCGRLAAELLLRLGRPHDARTLFERQAQPNGGSWAWLGVARAMMASGDNLAAKKLIQQTLKESTATAEAHDLMGRLLVDLGDFETALSHCRSATELAPGCLVRAQQAGTVAYFQGSVDEARAHLNRTVSLGVQSKLFDPFTLVLLALLQFDKGENAATQSLAEQFRRLRERLPASDRLDRLGQILQALAQAPGVAHIDLEAASLLLALWVRLPVALRPQDEFQSLVHTLALRFCTSKSVTEVLLASVMRDTPPAAWIRACQAQIAGEAEAAMGQSMAGDPGGAVARLLQAGEQYGNVKLLDLASALARRHASTLDEGDMLQMRAQAGLERWAPGASHIAGLQRAGRTPGGLKLRA